MDKLQYQKYLKTEHWQTIRRIKLETSGFKCQMCSKSNKLHVHHNNYSNLHKEKLEDLIVLCEDCHKKHHNIKPSETEKCKTDTETIKDLTQHGLAKQICKYFILDTWEDIMTIFKTNIISENIIINMREIEEISSLGLGLMVGLRKKYPNIKFTEVSDKIIQIMDMVRLYDTLQPLSRTK